MGGSARRIKLHTRPTPLLGLLYCRRMRLWATDGQPHVMSVRTSLVDCSSFPPSAFLPPTPVTTLSRFQDRRRITIAFRRVVINWSASLSRIHTSVYSRHLWGGGIYPPPKKKFEIPPQKNSDGNTVTLWSRHWPVPVNFGYHTITVIQSR